MNARERTDGGEKRSDERNCGKSRGDLRLSLFRMWGR